MNRQTGFKQKRYEVNGVKYDTFEEYLFLLWANEAYNNKLISHSMYHPFAYTLFHGAKVYDIHLEKRILKPRTYTPDFELIIPEDSPLRDYLDWVPLCESLKGYFRIELKGSYILPGDLAQWKANQKWVYQKFGHFINEVTIDAKKSQSRKGKVKAGLFQQTWAPARARFGPGGKKSKRFDGCLNIEQFLKKIGR